MVEEMLGPMLLSVHNLHFYQTVMHGLREAIKSNQLLDFRAKHLAAAGSDS
jgi:queuine tRNA-ribosyltransferase